MVNFPQFYLKTLNFVLILRKAKKKKKNFEKTLQVHEGYFGHFRSKKYFDHFETFRGTFIALEVYGHFSHFLALMAYFSHFEWSNYVNELIKVSQWVGTTTCVHHETRWRSKI